MHNAQPAQPARPQMVIYRHQLVEVVVAVAAAAAGIGYLLADLHDTDMLPWLPRTAVTVAAVALLLGISEVRLARQLARAQADVEERLARIERQMPREVDTEVDGYSRGYLDGLAHRSK